jgi:hypothetical protein
MTVAYNQTRDWMMGTFDLTEDQAITAITVAVDFGVTQASLVAAAAAAPRVWCCQASGLCRVGGHGPPLPLVACGTCLCAAASHSSGPAHTPPAGGGWQLGCPRAGAQVCVPGVNGFRA